MTANVKSMLLLAVTLVAGFALGLFADASFVRARRDRIGELRRPPGFVAHMEDVIEPRSTTQLDSLQPVLERFAQQNNLIVRDANAKLHATLDSMRTVLAPLLDASQRDRLAAEISRVPNLFRPGGRGGPPGRGGPFDGRGREGFPGDRYPPPPGRGGPPRGGPPGHD